MALSSATTITSQDIPMQVSNNFYFYIKYVRFIKSSYNEYIYFYI